MNYTKGEWETGVAVIEALSDEKQHCVGLKSDIHNIVACTGIVGAKDEQESIANAQLIAAAPDMYEVLKMAIVEIFNAPMFPNKYLVIKQMEVAIAKAEGRL